MPNRADRAGDAMTAPPHDIRQAMSAPTEPAAPSAGGGPGPGLNSEEFATRFAEASKALWYIAAGVLGGRSEADDVVQEAAVIGLRKLAEFDRGSNFAAWMGEIVRNIARNSARKQGRRQTAAVDPSVMDESRAAEQTGAGVRLSARGDLIADDRNFDDRVLRALGTLDEIARVCLLLRVLGGLSYAEISRILGIPEGTAMSHVHRTKRALREQLKTSADERPSVGPAGPKGGGA